MNTYMKIFFSLFLLSNISISLASNDELLVSRIIPAGEQASTSEISITFNQEMVPLGVMERSSKEIAINIKPNVNCQWRWSSTNTLTCAIRDQDRLKQATSYSVTVPAGFSSFKGKKLKNSFQHYFITTRPDVVSVNLQEWLSPTYPFFRLSTNNPVRSESLEKSIYFVVGSKKIPIVVIPDVENNYTKIYINSFRAYNSKVSTIGSRWILAPALELPADDSVSLHLSPGLKNSEGNESNLHLRELLSFVTYPSFVFKGLDCSFDDKNADCNKVELNPLAMAYLNFSTTVNRNSFLSNCTINKKNALDFFKSDNLPIIDGDSYSINIKKKGQNFPLMLPPFYKARSKYLVECSKNVQDIFGRILNKELRVEINTTAREPTGTLKYQSAVLEKNLDSDAPFYATNLTSAKLKYDILTVNRVQNDQVFEIPLSKVDDISYSTPLGIKKILKGESGIVSFDIETNPSVSRPCIETSCFYQVTPFLVHVKLGHFNSLVWVRDLSTGAAIEGAEVSLIENFDLKTNYKGKIVGKTNAEGVAIFEGTESFNPSNERRFTLKIQTSKDISVIPFEENYLSSYSQWSYVTAKHGHMKVWGTSPQGIYKAGDSIDYKIYVRNQDLLGFVLPPDEKYTLTIVDPLGLEVHKRENISLDKFGSLYGSFKLAPSAAIGWYSFRLTSESISKAQNNYISNDEDDEQISRGFLTSHIVLVTDFTPAPFKPETELNKGIYIGNDSMQIQSRAKLFSGGPFGNAKTRVNVNISKTNFYSDHPVASSFVFSCEGYSSNSTTIYEQELKLNDQGVLNTEVKLDLENYGCGDVTVTSDIADERGKFFSSVKTAKYYKVDRFVGLKKNKYFFDSSEIPAIKFIVTDVNGNPLPDIAVSIQLEKYKVEKIKVKGAGNAYVEHAKTDWFKISECKKESKLEGASCEFKGEGAGYYKVVATVLDSKGKTSRSEDRFYISGNLFNLWEDSEMDRLEIISESKTVKVGDKARYLVKNPFPNTEALISIERYGIIKSWTQKFTTSTPIIEVDITEDLLPGFYISVLVFSPRVDKPLGPNDVDLGKPTYRMGHLEVKPKNPVKELEMKISTPKPEYRPGEEVEVKIQALAKASTKLPKEIQYAVVVLDESVLDLIRGGVDYFDVYRGIYRLDDLDVRNYTILNLLIGRQKFEKKGANTGGDGGALSYRTLMKYVAHWNPNLIADKTGNASFKFKLPDNLTGWRIIVMAVDSKDRMGLGHGQFKSNRPTEIRSVMPNQIFEGDSFQGAFSVMNRTKNTRKIKVEVSASGDLKEVKNPIFSKTVDVKSFERKKIDFQVNSSILKFEKILEGGSINFEISASDSIDSDALKHTIPVRKKRSFVTAGTYGTFTEGKIDQEIHFPSKLEGDVGDLSVTFSPTVLGNLEEAFRFAKYYPYSCWEQRLTVGTIASSFLNLKQYIDPKLKWDEASDLSVQTVTDALNFQAKNGGMGYYKGDDQYVSPYLSAFTGIAFQWLRDRQINIDISVENKLHDYLLKLIRTDIFPDYFSTEMSSSVRAVSLAVLAKAKKIDISDIERFRPKIAQMDLFGKANYLQAALMFIEGESAAKEVLSNILGHVNETAGKIRLVETLNGDWNRIHTSELRSQCAVLSAFSKASTKSWAINLMKDVPFKLVRNITSGFDRGKYYWANTQDTIFCSEALIEYSRNFEKVPPDMKVVAQLDNKIFGEGILKSFKDKPITFINPITNSNSNQKTVLSMKREGEGRTYYSALLRYAPMELSEKNLMAGIEIHREYSVIRNGISVILKSPMKIKQGELIKIDLFISVPSSRNYVIVDDAVPGGLEPLNSDLANTSSIDTKKANTSYDKSSYFFHTKDWIDFSFSSWGFYHREITHNAVRFYSEYLSKGNYHLSYMAQAIAPGRFTVMPSFTGEMYEQDVFGKTAAAILEVDSE